MSVQGLTCQQAGKKGGQATLAKHGPAHFRRLAAIKNGRAGNAAQRAVLGPAGMAEVSRKGGQALLAKYGRDRYVRLGRLSQAARRVAT